MTPVGLRAVITTAHIKATLMKIQSGTPLWGRDGQRKHSGPPCRHKVVNIIRLSVSDSGTYAVATTADCHSGSSAANKRKNKTTVGRMKH